LSELLPSSALGLGSDKVGQKRLNVLHLCHSQRIQNAKAKKNFSLQTPRLAASFQGLNSSLAQFVEELCSCRDMCKLL